jgi:aminoglycoside 6'-N-acetyltransferase
VVTDPDPENARAIRAYEKAGFEKRGLVETPDGRALLMVRDR